MKTPFEPASGKTSPGHALELARSQQLAGQLAEAESTCRRILAAEQDNHGALHLLGLIAHQRGRQELAVKMIGKAISVNPNEPKYHRDLGLLRIRQGKLDEGAHHLEAALALDPENVAAHLNLGNVNMQRGRFDEAAAGFLRLAALNPGNTSAHFGLGASFYAQGMLDSSAKSYRRVIELDPADAEAHGNLALVLCAQGNFEEATRAGRQALRLNPGNAVAQNNLGLALHALGDLDQAAECFRRALELDPQYAEAHLNFGGIFRDRGQLTEAVASFRGALALKPDWVEAHNNLGNVLLAEGRTEEAIAGFNRARAIAPRNPQVLNNLGTAYQAKGLLGQARACFEKALAVRPDFHITHNNLGLVMAALGQPERALDFYRKAVAIKPDYVAAHDNLLFCMNYIEGIAPAAIHAEHVEFGRKFEEPLKPAWQPHSNTAESERRLRIGYVSGDFRQHAVMHILEPVLAWHDKNAFEIHCYSTALGKDEVTERLQRYADHWHSLVGLNDDRAADRIREDRIDILVDLSGHTANNRLLVFARKPAPVQVSWIGYMSTTGLSAIDYRITDAYADPLGQTEAFHTETLWRLPSVTVFRPVDGSPPINPLPVLTSGQFTFACLNNLSKVTAEVIDLWARVLVELPGARLIFGNAGDPEIQERLIRQFSNLGVTYSQLVFKPKLPLLDYLSLHHEIDLALDPFPYNGGVTSCHSLWMGVPFVTLVGDRYMGRMGVSLLNSVGLEELCAKTPDEYASLAVRLASDPARLAEIRATLRERVAGSLADEVRFTRNLESAYQKMWGKWCSGHCLSAIG